MCLSFTAGVYAQGLVDFRNKITGFVDAAVYADTVGGTKLAGDFMGGNFVAQLYFGTANTPNSFNAIADPPVPFRTGAAAGYWNAGADSSRALPGIAAGTMNAWVQVRVWDLTKGATYDAAKAAGSLYGLSNAFQVDATGPPAAPGALLGLQQFALQGGVIPEPSTIALGLLGLGALLFRRRR